MKEISKEVLINTSKSLMFEMNDKELDTLLVEFNTLIKQMELIGKIKGVDDAIPMTFPFPLAINLLREDRASKPLEKEEALKNATDVVDGQIRLPKVVG